MNIFKLFNQLNRQQDPQRQKRSPIFDAQLTIGAIVGLSIVSMPFQANGQCVQPVAPLNSRPALPPYALDTALQAGLPPTFFEGGAKQFNATLGGTATWALTFFGGAMQFNATLGGTATWAPFVPGPPASGGVQVQNDLVAGNYIYLQPNNAADYLNTANRATYVLSFPSPLTSFSMRVAGLNNFDGTTISASYRGVPIQITAANFTNLNPAVANQLVVINGNTVASNGPDGAGTAVNVNTYDLTIPGPVDTVTVVSGKNTTDPVFDTQNVTIGLTLLRLCTSPPNLPLVKRITAINGVPITGFNNDGVPASADDNPNWPDRSTYLQGEINRNGIKSGDLVDYRIYFLADTAASTNVTICDLISPQTTFVNDSGGSGLGIGFANSAVALPTAPTYQTNALDGDRGTFYPPGTTPPAACRSSVTGLALTAADNTDGVIAVNVVTNPAILPFATAPGVPTNSYGFAQFQVRVK